VGHEGEKGKPLKHPPQALELLSEKRRKRIRVHGFEPSPHEVENEMNYGLQEECLDPHCNVILCDVRVVPER
jgi:hypothetical protein